MSSKEHSLKSKIFMAMVFIPAIPFVAILVIGWIYTSGSLERSVVENMERAALDHSNLIQSFLRERAADLRLAAETLGYDEMLEKGRLESVLEDMRQDMIAFSDLGVIKSDGVQVAYTGPFNLIGINYSDAMWFKRSMSAGEYTSDVFLGHRKSPHLIIALKIDGEQKSWIIRATVNTKYFNELVSDVRIGKTGEAYLVNSVGEFQTDRRSGGVLLEKDPAFDRFPKPNKGVAIYTGQDEFEESYLYAITRISPENWFLIVRQDESEAFGMLNKAAMLIVVVFLAGAVLILVLAYTLSHRMEKALWGYASQEERLKNQLVRAARLAELGEMAAGFAHEINNPLQVMKSDLALMEMIMDDSVSANKPVTSEDFNELRTSIEQLKIQISRCARITQAILKFGRRDKPEIREVAVKSFVDEVLTMVERKAKVNDIEIVRDLDKDLPVIQCDPTHLQQVLLNLMNNAMDSLQEMERPKAKVIVVKAKRDQDKIILSVNDNGMGIDPEDLGKIFTPFFTTKNDGRGTGLGLSVCHGIISGMGGSMAVESAKGHGATFFITLPTSTA